MGYKPQKFQQRLSVWLKIVMKRETYKSLYIKTRAAVQILILAVGSTVQMEVLICSPDSCNYILRTEKTHFQELNVASFLPSDKSLSFSPCDKFLSLLPCDKFLSYLDAWCFSCAGLEACLRPFWAAGGVLAPFFAPRAFFVEILYCHKISLWDIAPFSKLTWSAVGQVLAPWQVPLSPLSLAPKFSIGFDWVENLFCCKFSGVF